MQNPTLITSLNYDRVSQKPLQQLSFAARMHCEENGAEINSWVSHSPDTTEENM